MEVLGPKICKKHNLQSHKICTNEHCFNQKDILVCPQCTSKHESRHCDVIEVSLLNDKVHELMQKRVDFELMYQQACQELLAQLKKFKAFKQQILTNLNVKEKILNDLCRKIRKTIPYQKDRSLFKKNFGNLYLATRGHNPNFQLYEKYNNIVAEAINECNRSIHKLRVNRMQIPCMLKREHQISAIIKQFKQTASIPPIQFCQPEITQFKKETIKYKKLVAAQYTDSQLFRLGDQQFLSFNNRSKVINLYSKQNLAFAKTLYVGSQIQHMQVVGKHLMASNGLNNLYVLDLLNERFQKQYASSKHPQARVTALLALDQTKILNFVHNPNQIVAFKLQETPKLTLKVIKGCQSKAKCLSASLMADNFVASFDDKALRIFKNQNLQLQHEFRLENSSKSLTVLDSNSLLAGGDSDSVWMVDQRVQGVVGKFSMGATCMQIKRIYSNSFLANLGNCIKIYDCRVHKQTFKLHLDNPISHTQVLNSNCFITSGKELSIYQGIV